VARAGQISLGGRTLRQHTARGTVVNAAFDVGITSLSLARGFIVAGFLTRADYGVWGVIIVGLGTLSWLKQVGIGDKYIQQDEPDQELAFQRAFTLELIFSAALMALMVVVSPILALVYGHPEILAPSLVASLVMPAVVLQVPLWIHYRRMDFMRQRLLQGIDPIVSFVLTIGLAVAGAGYWSLVIGSVAGMYASGIASVLGSPYRLALRYDRGTLRRYLDFSWPLFLASLGGLVIAQASLLVGNQAVGLAGVGAISLASLISQYTDRVDTIVTGTLYPAICAVRDRTDLLFESFVKSNRLALMWGVPFGIGVTLFASDLVSFGIGERWRPAVVLIEVFGAIAAVNHIGFNWDAYFRARGETRPIAVVNLGAMVVFLATGVPLLLSHGLDGLAVGMGVMTVWVLAARTYFLTRLFAGFRMARHAARAIAPTVPAVIVVLALRAVETGSRTLPIAIAELVAYVAATAVATFALERSLLREVAGYLRRRAPGVPLAT
jgi:PST family polysaccharide transporter